MMKQMNRSMVPVAAAGVVAAAGAVQATPTFDAMRATFVASSPNGSDLGLNAKFNLTNWPESNTSYFQQLGTSQTHYTSNYSVVQRAEPATLQTGLETGYIESRGTGTISPTSVHLTGSVVSSFITNDSYTTGAVEQASGDSGVTFRVRLLEAAQVRVRFTATVDSVVDPGSQATAYLTLPSLDPDVYTDGLVFGVMADENTPGGVQLQTSGTLNAVASSLDFTFNAEPGVYYFNIRGILEMDEAFGENSLSWDFQLDIVPAPATAALLGLGGLVATRRRRA